MFNCRIDETANPAQRPRKRKRKDVLMRTVHFFRLLVLLLLASVQFTADGDAPSTMLASVYSDEYTANGLANTGSVKSSRGRGHWDGQQLWDAGAAYPICPLRTGSRGWALDGAMGWRAVEAARQLTA